MVCTSSGRPETQAGRASSFFFRVAQLDTKTQAAMALPARAPTSPDAPSPTWQIGVEVDLATALALSRAATKALLELSPLAHREITAALEHEIDVLERQSDPLSLAAANAVRQYLPEAA